MTNTYDEIKLNELEIWFRENEKLPKEIDRLLLRRFYQCMFGDIDEVKKLIELNYTLRNRYSHIFIKRDPTDAESQRTFDYADILPLPGLTPENCKVSLYRYRDFDPMKLHHTEDTRTFFMVTDWRFSTPDDPKNPNALSEGEVQIFDMAGTTMRHVSRLSISTLRIYVKFMQLAFPVRLKAIHMINCPSYLDRIVSIVKPFISKEVFQLIHFHTNSIDTLYDFVPREMLPKEYGGTCGTLNELRKTINKSVENKREYLMDPKNWLVEKPANSHSSSKSWRIFN